ncbi:MAG: glycosyltransferase [Eubacterium sp.]|nr:glycosyltransferase [Eubacterium sp.]
MIRLADLPEYPELNTFSPVRVNLVRTLELTGTERVLEIGADSAAITSYLAEKCAQVTAVCLNEQEAKIQKQVCAEHANVVLLNWAERDVSEKDQMLWANAPYDLITVIGTPEQAADLCRCFLENAAESTESTEPTEPTEPGKPLFVESLKDHLLAAEGKILLAGSAVSLRSVDSSAFADAQIFSLQPDYRFPMEMKAIPSLQEVLQSETDAEPASILICLSGRRQEPGWPRNLYTKFSNERRPGCAVFTQILEHRESVPFLSRADRQAGLETAEDMCSRTESGKGRNLTENGRIQNRTEPGKNENLTEMHAAGNRIVRKYPASQEAAAHIRRIGEVSEKLREQYCGTGIGINRCFVKKQGEQVNYIEFEYLSGENCGQEVDHILQTEGADAAIYAVCEYIRKIIPEEKCVPFHFTPGFAELFGNRAHEPFWGRTLPVTNIDCILENIIRTENGYQMIDCEWTTDIPVPVEFLIWRIVHYYLDGNPAADTLLQAGIYEKCGLSGNLDVYLDMENQFQKWIEGDVIPLHKYLSAGTTASSSAGTTANSPAGAFSAQPEQLTTLQKIRKHGTYLLGHGYGGYQYMLQTRPNRPFDENYDNWIRERLAKRDPGNNPVPGRQSRFGIILLRSRFDSRLYAASQASVQQQTYRNYIVYPGTVLRKMIAQAARECDYLMFLPTGYCLTPDALQYFAAAIMQSAPYLLYADEDRITQDGQTAFAPAFKPDFSIDYLRSYNYIGPCFCIRSRAAKDFSLNKLQTGDGFFYDLVLHAAELQETDAENRICHIPEVLFRKISVQGKTSAELRHEAVTRKLELEALKQHNLRCGIPAAVTEDPAFPVFRTNYQMQEEPLVSIIVPNKDHAEELRACIESFENLSTYRNFEWIIVENNSTEAETFACYRELEQRNQNSGDGHNGLCHPAVTVVTYEGPFNYSKINNFGVRCAKGEFLLLLNNDTELISPDALRQLVGTLQQEDAGIAGARLLYPDRRLQHGGIGLGIGGIAGHLFTDLEETDPGYGYRAVSTVDYSAVTAACLLVKKSLYEAVGGMEESLAVAFNDVDFCLKVRTRGKRVIYCGDVELYHKESRSRGLEDTQEKVDRFYSEIIWFIEKWRDDICAGDPFYNRNLSIESNPFYRLG